MKKVIIIGGAGEGKLALAVAKHVLLSKHDIIIFNEMEAKGLVPSDQDIEEYFNPEYLKESIEIKKITDPVAYKVTAPINVKKSHKRDYKYHK